jgi:hypothetical protein
MASWTGADGTERSVCEFILFMLPLKRNRIVGNFVIGRGARGGGRGGGGLGGLFELIRFRSAALDVVVLLL